MGCSSNKSLQLDDEQNSIDSVLQTESITFEVESGLKPKYF